MQKEIKAKILEIFQSHRQKPDLPFEEEYFLDFLLANKIKRGYIRNSFRGLFLYNRFMETLQLEFGICLKLEDKQKNYSLDELVEKVEERLANPKSSKAAMRYLLRQPFEWKAVLFLNAFLIIGAAFSYEFLWLFLLLLSIWVLLNGCLLYFYLRKKRFTRKLAQIVLLE